MSRASISGRVDPALRACAGDCLTAAAACDQALEHLRSQGGGDARLRRVLQQTADCCRRTAAAHTDGGSADEAALTECAALCARCAEMCSALEGDVMRACAEACLRAASSCGQAGAPPEQRPSQDKISADSFPASDPPSSMAQATR